MRPGLQPDSALDRLAIRLNLAPVAAGHALFGMPMSRVTIAGQRLGIFARLARGRRDRGRRSPRSSALQPDGTMLLLDSLAALEHVDKRGDRYSLSKSGRKWLDPDSGDYVGTYIEHCFDYWSWWDRLEDIVRTGEGIEIHDFPADDPHWEKYIRGQFELARISSPEVAKALRLPPQPSRCSTSPAGTAGTRPSCAAAIPRCARRCSTCRAARRSGGASSPSRA